MKEKGELHLSGENTEDADQPADIEVPALEVHLPPSQEVTFDRANPPVLSEDGESVSPQEPQSMHTKWKIPCFVKETGERKKPRSPRSARAAKMLQRYVNASGA